ncbi:lysophospholipid transporter LplT [Lautropia dentalis]|jgi:major facilitator superfamily (MFS_1) transporter|uniref:Lysophospholipid transporter LplT n=1 Tax=Lautropia dentalis TaxID=2490857 RepID=A0A3R8NUA4_9BURK|nr:lysophospholipid transporter LplT [Lautropia dentalis]RRN45986.1 lysophospholipid transporter LplT [Lautropia dentalis]
MKPGFYTIMAAQFLSSLADNALLIAAIALLNEAHSADWLIPFLKLVFVVSYVLLAPFVGAFADAIPKGRVMFLTNAIKLLGCILLLGMLPPLAAYALVGFGAAAYSPAKYGILTELLPPEKLVAANGWIEGTTVASIILGTVLGGVLISPHVAPWLLSFDLPVLDTHIDTPAEAAVMVIIGIYGAAALINLRIPDTGARYPERARHPLSLLQSFWRCNLTLWRDPLGQIALAVTTLFWGAGASLQFLVLKWAEHQLDMRLDQATRLQGIVALGVALGAVLAASWVPLKRSLRVLPLGAAMGVAVAAMSLVHNEILAMIVLLVIGLLSGFFVVPMNALLQHRGYVVMSAGHSIAVQNFNENLNILVMLLFYALMLWLNLPINLVTVLFGLTVSAIMVLVMIWHRRNQRINDTEHLIGEDPHHGNVPGAH